MKFTGISTVYVYVGNIEESKEFYSKTFSMGKPINETPNWVEWKAGNGANFAIKKARDHIFEGSVPRRSTIRFFLEVPDVRAAYNELFEKGIRVLSEPQEGTNYVYVDVLDIDRNVIRLVQHLK